MATSISFDAVGGLAATSHGTITRRLAARHGLDRNIVARLIARGLLMEPVPGVLCIAGSPATWEQLAMIAVLAGGDRNVLIGASAARLHDLDGFRPNGWWCGEIDQEVHVAVPKGSHIAVGGVRTAQTLASYPADDVIILRGLRVSGLARTLCDVAQFHPDRYERAADDFQRRGSSLAWLDTTARRVRRTGRPGPAAVIADVDRRRHGGRVRESWFESLVEHCIRSPLLGSIERQYTVRDSAGRFVARVDLAIPSLRLAIEAHSRQFHTGPVREAADQDRDNRLAIEGWHTTYVGWAEATRTPRQVCTMIEQLVARRALDLGMAHRWAS